MGGIVDPMSSAAGIGPIFGNDKDSGLLGLGQYKGDIYSGNKGAFYENKPAEQDRSQIGDFLNSQTNVATPQASAAQLGAAPTMSQNNAGGEFNTGAAQSGNYATTQAAQTNLANMRQYGGAQLSPMQNAQAAQIGQMQQGQAAQAQGTNINTAQQNQFRNAQGGLAALEAQAATGQGPSIANMQLQQGLGANLQSQMAAAQSQRGFGNAGATQRNLANQAASANMQTEQAAAQQRVNETLAARQQLADISSQARGQDIGLAQSQAQLGQQNQQFNAGNQQQMALANMGYTNQASLAQAQLQQQTNLANQAAQNTGSLTQAQLYQQANLAGQEQYNQAMMANTGYQQQAGMFNAGNQQQMYQQNLANQQQTGLANQQANLAATQANMGMQGQYGMANAGFQQQANLANQQAALNMNQQNNQQTLGLMGMQTSLDLQEQQNRMAYEQMMAQQYSSVNAVNQKAYSDAQKSKSSLLAGIGGGMLSDEDEKKDIKPIGNPTMDDFLNMQKGTTEAGAAQASKEENSPSFLQRLGTGLQTYDNLNNNRTAQGQTPTNPYSVALNAAAPSIFPKPAQMQNPYTKAQPAIANPNPYAQAMAPVISDKGLKDSVHEFGSGEVDGMLKPVEPIASDPESGGGGLLSKIPIIGGLLSDEKTKTNVESGKESITDFIDKVEPHQFKYKNPNMQGADDKTHFSPMAQELEKSKIGKSMVYDTPNGKMVDFQRGLGAILAVQANLNERLKKMEGK